MHYVKLLILFSLSFSTYSVSLAAEPQFLSQKQLSAGWIQLFDGETLFGWQPTSDADWRVMDGEIQVSQGEPGFLMTTSEFADFELYLEYRAPLSTNSGIFLRSRLESTNPAQDCYEINIAPPENPFPTGSIVTHALAAFSERHPAADTWHTYLMRAEGNQIHIFIDGEEVLAFVDEDATRSCGHIGLQLNQGAVAFRNVRLRPLGMAPIFNGRDLTGWNTNRAEASRFAVTQQGDLQVLDGRGQLESEHEYDNFVLQLECFVAGDELNSGVFFRCIPGDFMNGYECQIHNGYRNNDPTQPVDCGTGGIFRRQNARHVVSRDHEWFTLTIIADGPHMAAWVNGYPVSDWIDTRPPDENPRNGLRLARGTLAIQGHDPTTNLRFRNIRITELPLR